MHIDIEKATTREKYNLLIGLVAPRPIAWVTSMDSGGLLNAAPYSAYNYLCTDPPIIGIGVMDKGQSVPKDTARNIREIGEFVVNVTTEDLIHQMSICATDFPAGVNELEMAGLTTTPSSIVKVPRIAEAHAALECVEYRTIDVGQTHIILGRVVAMYIDDRFVDASGPYILAEELHAIGRMNGLGSYVKTNGAFVQEPRIPYAEWLKGKR